MFLAAQWTLTVVNQLTVALASGQGDITTQAFLSSFNDVVLGNNGLASLYEEILTALILHLFLCILWWQHMIF